MRAHGWDEVLGWGRVGYSQGAQHQSSAGQRKEEALWELDEGLGGRNIHAMDRHSAKGGVLQ